MTGTSRATQRVCGQEVAARHAEDVPGHEQGLELPFVEASHIKSRLHQHHGRVERLSRFLALSMGLSVEEADVVAAGGLLHDVGKLFIPDDILEKPGPLTTSERKLMQQHTVWGYVILSRRGLSTAGKPALVALQHHECWDGSGYPFGLKAEEICLEARIVAACDVYDALRSHRSYSNCMDHASAIDIVLRGDDRIQAGKFDPAVLEVIENCHEGFADIMMTRADADTSAISPSAA